MNDTAIKTCPYCKNVIKKDAVYCSTCNHFLNWRRFLNFGNTFLALLVALISVVSFAVPIIKESLKPDNSKVVLNPPFTEAGTIVLIASNSGKRQGNISKAILAYNLGSEIKSYRLRNESSERSIQAGQSSKLVFSFYRNGRLNFMADSAHMHKISNVKLHVEVIEFNMERQSQAFSMDTVDLKELLGFY